MKKLCTLVVALSLAALAGAEDKKAEKFDAAKMVGTWSVTGGKKAGNDVSDEAKKGSYVITKDKFTIQTEDGKDAYVIEYTLDEKVTPIAVDMKITKSPGDSANDSKAKGIIELSGDELKICYDPMGGDRPTKFDGAKAYYFTMKKKEEKKK